MKHHKQFTWAGSWAVRWGEARSKKKQEKKQWPDYKGHVGHPDKFGRLRGVLKNFTKEGNNII